VQRGGPSTGLPTKTEQSDLLQALYGRNGESPVVVLAASTPSDCFFYAYRQLKLLWNEWCPLFFLPTDFWETGANRGRFPKWRNCHRSLPGLQKMQVHFKLTGAMIYCFPATGHFPEWP